MQKNNKAFVLDHPFDDSVDWAFYNNYQGGSLTFDVNVNQVECGCAAGVYLTALDDENCSWNSYPFGSTPQCSSIDIMEANKFGFNAATHPCEDGSCDIESLTLTRANDLDPSAFGPGKKFTIDSRKKFTVKTQFFTEQDEDGDYSTLKRIVTTLK